MPARPCRPDHVGQTMPARPCRTAHLRQHHGGQKTPFPAAGRKPRLVVWLCSAELYSAKRSPDERFTAERSPAERCPKTTVLQNSVRRAQSSSALSGSARLKGQLRSSPGSRMNVWQCPQICFAHAAVKLALPLRSLYAFAYKSGHQRGGRARPSARTSLFFFYASAN